MLKIKGLSVGYLSDKVIENLSIEVDFSSIVAVLGNNGSGKSTFLHALRHTIPSEGFLSVKGRQVTESTASDYFSYLGQSYQFNFPFIVSDFIRINHSSSKYNDRFDFLVKELKLESLINKKLQTLSQGQQQKCLIAQTLLQDSDIILLDEPESFLDLKNRAVLAESLLNYKEKFNKIIIIVTHDLDLVSRVSDKILNFSGDGIVLDDNTIDNVAKHKAMLLR